MGEAINRIIGIPKIEKNRDLQQPDGTRARSLYIYYYSKGNDWPDQMQPLGIIRDPEVVDKEGNPISDIIEPDTLPETIKNYEEYGPDITYPWIKAIIDDSVRLALQAALGAKK